LETKLRTASLQEILATRARSTFAYRINFDSVSTFNIPLMKTWCDQHCCDIWRSETFLALYFQFANEKDATMFMLRWGTADGNKLK